MPLTIYPDVQVTRRKAMHCVMNEQELMIWTGAKFSALIDWLYENGEQEFLVQTDGNKFRVRIDRRPD